MNFWRGVHRSVLEEDQTYAHLQGQTYAHPPKIHSKVLFFRCGFVITTYQFLMGMCIGLT